jgi:hypothetical protein
MIVFSERILYDMAYKKYKAIVNLGKISYKVDIRFILSLYDDDSKSSNIREPALVDTFTFNDTEYARFNPKPKLSVRFYGWNPLKKRAEVISYATLTASFHAVAKYRLAEYTEKYFSKKNEIFIKDDEGNYVNIDKEQISIYTIALPVFDSTGISAIYLRPKLIKIGKAEVENEEINYMPGVEIESTNKDTNSKVYTNLDEFEFEQFTGLISSIDMYSMSMSVLTNYAIWNKEDFKDVIMLNNRKSESFTNAINEWRTVDSSMNNKASKKDITKHESQEFSKVNSFSEFDDFEKFNK